MSRYLSALKISEKGGEEEPKKPKQPPLTSSLGSLGTPPPHFETNQAANDPGQAADNLACFRWVIHFSDHEPVEGTFSPMATNAEVLARWLSAIAVEPMPERQGQATTDSEAAMLCALVTAIYRDDTGGDRDEALAAALADPYNALACYTAIAAERGLTVPDNDDRRTCRQCLNLRGGACSVATPGGALSAQRGYRPGVLWQDKQHRCEGFSERNI